MLKGRGGEWGCKWEGGWRRGGEPHPRVSVICRCPALASRRCRMVLSRRCRCALSRGFVVACWHVVVLRSCCVVVPRRLVVSEGGWSESAMTHQTGTMNNNQCRHSSFGCHVAISDVAPGFRMVIWVRGRLFGFMGGRWHLWAVRVVVPHCGRWAPCGGCRRRRRRVVVVVVIRSVGIHS